VRESGNSPFAPIASVVVPFAPDPKVRSGLPSARNRRTVVVYWVFSTAPLDTTPTTTSLLSGVRLTMREVSSPSGPRSVPSALNAKRPSWSMTANEPSGSATNAPR